MRATHKSVPHPKKTVKIIIITTAATPLKNLLYGKKKKVWSFWEKRTENKWHPIWLNIVSFIKKQSHLIHHHPHRPPTIPISIFPVFWNLKRMFGFCFLWYMVIIIISIIIIIILGTFHSYFWLNYHFWDDSSLERVGSSSEMRTAVVWLFFSFSRLFRFTLRWW